MYVVPTLEHCVVHVVGAEVGAEVVVGAEVGKSVMIHSEGMLKSASAFPLFLYEAFFPIPRRANDLHIVHLK